MLENSNKNEKLYSVKEWVLNNIENVEQIILSTTSVNEDKTLKDRILIGVVSSSKDTLKIRRVINEYNKQSKSIILCFIPAGDEEYFSEMKGGTIL